MRNDCGNLLCVNPAHWRDEGPKKVSVKLGEVRQAEIERLARDTDLSIDGIAAAVGCSRSTVWRRMRGLSFGPKWEDADAELRS